MIFASVDLTKKKLGPSRELCIDLNRWSFDSARCGVHNWGIKISRPSSQIAKYVCGLVLWWWKATSSIENHFLWHQSGVYHILWTTLERFFSPRYFWQFYFLFHVWPTVRQSSLITSDMTRFCCISIKFYRWKYDRVFVFVFLLSFLQVFQNCMLVDV